jgi:hypothetical protein
MELQRIPKGTLAFIIGVPAAWGILLLFHPGSEDSRFYPAIDGHVFAWQAVHIGMAVFVPLFAAAVYLLLRGVNGPAAAISRIGLAAFAVFYAAFEITLGVGTGILTEQVNALPAGEQAVGVEVLESYATSGVITAFTILGSIGLIAAMVGAAFALRGAYGLGQAPLALLILSTPLIAIHEPPLGPIGLATFIVAVVLFVRQRGQSPPRLHDRAVAPAATTSGG